LNSKPRESLNPGKSAKDNLGRENVSLATELLEFKNCGSSVFDAPKLWPMLDASRSLGATTTTRLPSSDLVCSILRPKRKLTAVDLPERDIVSEKQALQQLQQKQVTAASVPDQKDGLVAVLEIRQQGYGVHTQASDERQTFVKDRKSVV
jgi:hypothetical protein